MGATQAAGMAEAIGAGLIDRTEALRWHLKHNHFPPVPGECVRVAEEAIEHAEQGEWEAMVALLDVATWRGRRCAPVNVIVRAWHLDAFIRAEEV
jgi:hypothetical protein